MKNILKALYNNHVLANLSFILIIAMGALSYFHMPREQDPSINFNWIQITTLLPGASAEDVEKLVTDRLEEAIYKLNDIKFVSSNSREGVSSILVRFEDLSNNEFDKRVTDLRREIQNKEDELPAQAKTSTVLELTSANAFPSAMLVAVGQADDERLRTRAKNIKEDLERLGGVDRVETFGLHAPELQVLFNSQSLINHNTNPIAITNTIQANYNDVSAGTLHVGTNEWLVRWVGKLDDPEQIARLPIVSAKHELILGEVARVQRGREKPSRLVNYKGKNAVMLSVMKQANTNTLELIDKIRDYVDKQQHVSGVTGVDLVLLDDQTEVTRNALNIMQTNAIYGLILVLLTTWIFLGFRIAALVSIGIPFTLAGTIWMLDGLGNTLNVSVLLGVVIALGIIVDDSVVVVEGIYYRLSHGKEKLDAILSSLKEVFAPVTTSVLTTIAAFTPLMLLPGILGKFMMVIPLVVTIALIISLVEAYWMLPAHIAGLKADYSKPSKIQLWRNSFTHKLRIKYTRLLIKVFRRPKMAFSILIAIVGLAVAIIASGLIHFNFFASDPLRLFYVNIEMPAGSSLDNTLKQTRIIEEKVRANLAPDETRSVTAYAGLQFTEIEPFLGDQYGQVAVSLKPQKGKLREVDSIIESMRQEILNTAGPINISFLRMAGGPPTSKPVNIKVRGTDYAEIRQAVKSIKGTLNNMPHVYDISDDDSMGRTELVLKPNYDAIHRAGINPADVTKIIHLLIDGEIVSDLQSNGEKVEVRVRQIPKSYSGIREILQQTINHNGRELRLSELVHADTNPSLSNIRHYNFRRAITVTAEIDKDHIDTVQVNKEIQDIWYSTFALAYPGIDLNFTGELDDIQESIDAIPRLFLFGLGIVYLILGTQFRSYWQPLMIISTIPLAFTGVTFGLLLTNNPLSLFTMYGIVALSGITINASIVLISAANQRREMGMSLNQATLYAARRRVVPILITSLTTIAGLFSLATGLGGKSLLWGPVATSIVWGLFFATTLTLFFIPLLYRITQKE